MAKQKKMGILDYLTQILLIVSGLNWGLSIFKINLVEMIANITFAFVGTALYALVGLSAVYWIYRMYQLST